MSMDMTYDVQREVSVLRSELVQIVLHIPRDIALKVLLKTLRQMLTFGLQTAQSLCGLSPRLCLQKGRKGHEQLLAMSAKIF